MFIYFNKSAPDKYTQGIILHISDNINHDSQKYFDNTVCILQILQCMFQIFELLLLLKMKVHNLILFFDDWAFPNPIKIKKIVLETSSKSYLENFIGSKLVYKNEKNLDQFNLFGLFADMLLIIVMVGLNNQINFIFVPVFRIFQIQTFRQFSSMIFFKWAVLNWVKPR